jgi:hypothetical protein
MAPLVWTGARFAFLAGRDKRGAIVKFSPRPPSKTRQLAGRYAIRAVLQHIKGSLTRPQD